MGVMSVLSPIAIVRQLRLGKDSSTFVRLGQSRHVADLRLIFSVTVILMIVGTIVALLFCFEDCVINNWKDLHNSGSIWPWIRQGFAGVAESGPFIGAIVVLGGGVLAWTYQTGSARLGVVDLFACEIATLCRVGAVVDMVERYVDLYEKGPQPRQVHHAVDGAAPTDTKHFSSQESYFPVFEASVKDLQALEADVVKHVTAFYTYMKVMRDTLRKLADIAPPAAGGHTDDWHQAIGSVVYMQFLALESARKAIKDLVEFEPTQAEDMITVLLSELPAYGFLNARFRGDLRHRRLESREEAYQQEVPALYRQAMVGEGEGWIAARDLAAEMIKRFHQVFPERASHVAREPELA
jgi:hypothetical protein